MGWPGITAEALEELVGRAAAGERTAQDELLMRCWDVIRMVVQGRLRCMPKLGERTERVDLEQETAIHLLRELPRYRWEGESSFKAWIRRIAETRVADAGKFFRAKRRNAPDDGDAEEVAAPALRSAESNIDLGRNLTAALTLVATLNEEQRAAVVMHQMGFTYGEIGETIGCSGEAARKLVGRSIEKLRSSTHVGPGTSKPSPRRY